jgi:hypothetical protein
MATYELYLGGARQQNANFAMLPSAPFSASQPFVPVVKQIPVTFFLARNYDFGYTQGIANDPALQDWLANLATPLTSGDKLGSVVIPSDFLALGIYWKITTPLASGQFALGTRIGGTSLVAATTTGTANSAWVPWPSAPVLFKTPDIIDLTLTTVPAGGVGSLSIVAGVCGYHFRAGLP